MKKGLMSMYNRLPNGASVELSGKYVTYWESTNVDSPTYEGPIDLLPAEVLETLLAADLIRPCSE